ncbi:MAG TPA: DoxX family protein [Flavitalea sp.]|nr:DoxX family protein [Flavitalea sp.]
MKRFFAPLQLPLSLDLVLLLMRIVCGIGFIIFGWPKIQHPFTWMEPTRTPGFLQLLAAISEFCGGIALIAGLFTRLAAFGITCTMLVAVYMLAFVYHAPFVSMTGGIGYVLPSILLITALLFLVAGPGKFSLDRLLFGNGSVKSRTMYYGGSI